MKGVDMGINAIAAIGERNRVIGRDNTLPWSKHLKPDMNRFKDLTKGRPVIMGRSTWESLDPRFKPLPNRTNIVVTNTPNYELPREVIRAHSVFGATEHAEHFPGGDEIFIIGGQRIYEQAMRVASRLYLTLVDEDAEGDRFFPDYSAFSKVLEHIVVPDFEPRLTFLMLARP